MEETLELSITTARQCFADRLRAVRLSRLFSQEALSSRSGIAAATISRYERGQSEPRLEGLVALAHALRVTPDYLLGIDLKGGEADSGMTQLFAELRLARPEQVRMIRDFWEYLKRKENGTL